MSVATYHTEVQQREQPRLNLHALLAGNDRRDGLLQALDLTGREDSALRQARRDIRQTLRKAGRHLDVVFAEASEVLSSRVPLRMRKHMSDVLVEPRFLTQGSFAYRTLNRGCHMPPQEIDLDDGVYFPTSFFENGEPWLLALGMFAFVERSLLALCRERGWSIDTSKDTCVRIHLNHGLRAHIDLPLYAIPDAEFARLQKDVASMYGRAVEALASFSEAIDQYPRILRIDPERVMLAHRKWGWIASDPRRVNDWARETVAFHGERIRRVWRYAKAWRDFQWQASEMKSIKIMAAIAEAYEMRDDTPVKGRDDLELLAVVELLPEILGGRIVNPAEPSTYFEPCQPEHLLEFRSRMMVLASALSDAIYRTHYTEIAVRTLRAQFGDRVPDDLLMVKVRREEVEAPRATAPAAVYAAAPLVTRATSG